MPLCIIFAVEVKTGGIELLKYGNAAQNKNIGVCERIMFIVTVVRLVVNE